MADQEGSFKLERVGGKLCRVPLQPGDDGHVPGPTLSLDREARDRYEHLARHPEDVKQEELVYPAAFYWQPRALNYHDTSHSHEFPGFQFPDANYYRHLADEHTSSGPDEDQGSCADPTDAAETSDIGASASTRKKGKGKQTTSRPLPPSVPDDMSEADWAALSSHDGTSQDGTASHAPFTVEQFRESVKKIVSDLHDSCVIVRAALRRNNVVAPERINTLAKNLETGWSLLKQAALREDLHDALQSECFKHRDTGLSSASQTEVPAHRCPTDIKSRDSTNPGYKIVTSHDLGRHKVCLMDSLLEASAVLDRHLCHKKPEEWVAFATRTSVACSTLANKIQELGTTYAQWQRRIQASNGDNAPSHDPIKSLAAAHHQASLLNLASPDTADRSMCTAIGRSAHAMILAMKQYDQLMSSDEAKKIRPDGGRIAGPCDMATKSNCSGGEPGLLCGSTLRSVESLAQQWLPYATMASAAWADSIRAGLPTPASTS